MSKSRYREGNIKVVLSGPGRKETAQVRFSLHGGVEEGWLNCAKA